MDERLDVAIVSLGLSPSRQKARALIEAGHVKLNGIVTLKPATRVPPDAVIEAADVTQYVGRGGQKLEHALDVFNLDPKGKNALDIGASTGGFTECLLRRGAPVVAAVDVGTCQLAPALACDSRVRNMEGTDIRALTPSTLGFLADIVVCDVSFISVAHILPHLHQLTSVGCDIIILVKPQFEAGRGAGKKGVIRDKKTHLRVINEHIEAVKQHGFTCVAMTHSPVTGGSGNIEFFSHLRREGISTQQDIKSLVETAHSAAAKADIPSKNHRQRHNPHG